MNTTEPPTILLSIERPGEPAQTHTFRGAKALVGRETGEIVLRDAETSALHAEIDCTQGAVVVRDLGSSNGTWRAKVGPDGTESWERLPQFALLVGGRFRCGATIVRLVSIEGVEPIAAGRTVVSGTRDAVAPAPAPVASGVTVARLGAEVDRPSVLPAPVASASSSAATLPGKPERTIVGQAPAPAPPAGDPPRAHITEPFRPAERGDPDAAAIAPEVAAAALMRSASTVPATAAPEDPAPVADAASTMRAPTQIAPFTPATPPVEPTPSAPIPEPPRPVVGRPPVANALIRPGGKPITGPAAVVPPAPGSRRWLRMAGLGALGLVLVGLVGGGIWWAIRHFTGGPPPLALAIAKELPDDTLGFVALASPRAQLEVLGDAVPQPMRTEATEAWGFDPFAVAGWEASGIDPDGEVGFALLEISKPTMSISLGLGDAAKLRAALPGMIAKIAKIPAPTLSDRTFGDVPGLWLEEPIPAAILLRERRAIAIVGIEGSDAATVARHAERIATLEGGASLAERPGFAALGPEPGTPMVVAYVDGVSMRNAVPAGTSALIALRTGFGEVDAFAFTLAADGPRIHTAWQTVLREGSAGLNYIGDAERSGRALSRIPGPGLAAADVAFAAKPIVDTVTAFATLAGVFSPAETAFKEATNLDLRSDVVDNIGGELGIVLQRLPSKKSGTDFGVIAFASVKDSAKARTALDSALAALQRHVFEVPATTETIGDTPVHTFAVPGGDEAVRISLFVVADQLFVAAGQVDARAIVEGTGKSLRDSARNDAIREALGAGDIASGFADIRELISAAAPLLSDREREEQATAKPLIDPLEVVTFRVSARGRVTRAKVTLHTSAEQALPTLVRAAMQVAGEGLAKAVGRERRAAECERLIAQLETIAKTDTTRTLLDFSLRFDLREACEQQATSEQLACAATAKTFADVEACGGADAGLLPPDPEPQAVPYVEDIWPNTRASPSDGATPRAEVNYGVDLGLEPQFRGRADALVTIIEFGDFQCPYCREVTATLDDVLSRHGDDVRVVFRHNPLAIHADAKPAAKAALAAAKQGKFWAMHDRLFESQYELGSGKFHDYAVALGLDAAQFDRDFADGALDRRIEDDLATAKRFGVTGTPAFFINGRFLSGNQPVAVFDRVLAEELVRARTFVERRGNTRKRLYDDMASRWATEVGRPTAVALPPDSGERFNLDTTGMPIKGATGFARVKLVECGDFECPYCQRATKTITRILADYPTQVMFAFAHNPLSFHSRAEPAARAAAAADLQGKFWEMHDKLFADPDALGETAFALYARELKLDVDKFKADMASAEIATKVSDQKKLCTDNGGSSTPTFFLNGRRIEGAQSYETFKALIDAELLGGI